MPGRVSKHRLSESQFLSCFSTHAATMPVAFSVLIVATFWVKPVTIIICSQLFQWLIYANFPGLCTCQKSLEIHFN